jgi:adenosylhomocysteine/aminodeoxyfutalosine nucleosidase
MVEELEPLLTRAQIEEVEEVGKNRYYLGKLGGVPVVMAYSKIGKVFSAITATTLVLKYQISQMIFSGVAGALDPSLKIGDIVIADGVCQHDVDLTAFGHPAGYIPGGEVCYPTDPYLRELAREAGRELGLKIVEGHIATGDQFIADPSRKEWIRREFGAIAVEMEGGAVGKVAWSFDIPLLIIRAISDSAGEKAQIDFDTFLKTSSLQSAQLVEKVLEHQKKYHRS